ncbi:MAG TPA: hypothetical protein VFA38_05300, partial [Nitrospirales bacterium]|nr:hypothetical protein [Nitrospirales bacterium]
MPQPRDPAPLLLAPGLSAQKAAGLLRPYGVTDFKRADANLQAMAGEPRSREILATILENVLDGISHTADPDLALTHWEQY